MKMLFGIAKCAGGIRERVVEFASKSVMKKL